MAKDYKVVFVPVFGEDAVFEQEYDTKKEAVAVLDAIANYTLLLHECSYMQDYSNSGKVIRKDGDEWVEIDDDGNLIWRYLDGVCIT